MLVNSSEVLATPDICELLLSDLSELPVASPTPLIITDRAKQDYVSAHSKKVRKTARFVTGQFTRIAHPQLLSHFDSALAHFLKSNPTVSPSEIVVIVPNRDKSPFWMSRWAAQKMRSHSFPNSAVAINQNTNIFNSAAEKTLGNFLKANSRYKHVVLFDDGAFTGKQQSETIAQVARTAGRIDLRFHVVSAVGTRDAQKQIEQGRSSRPLMTYPDGLIVHSYFGKFIPSFNEIVDKEKPGRKVRKQLARMYDIFPGASTYYFDHSFPDGLSFVAPKHDEPRSQIAKPPAYKLGDSIIWGFVVRSDGSVKPKLVPLSDPPKRIYQLEK